MLWNKREGVKSYSKVFNIILCLMLGISCIVYSNRLSYNKKIAEEEVSKVVDQKTAVLNEAKAYIKSLEKENKEKGQQIQSYKAYESYVKTKLEKIDQLEKEIQEKLDESGLLGAKDLDIIEGIEEMKDSSKIQQISYIGEGERSIEIIDHKINVLEKIKKQLEELVEKEKHMPSLLPCRGEITSGFGDREDPFKGWGSEKHKGIDIANKEGTKIHSTAKGIVTYAAYQTGYGKVVYIDHGNGLTSIYAHASKLCVERGEEVEKGQVVALVGSTGKSTGPHVHFEMRKDDEPIDPFSLLK